MSGRLSTCYSPVRHFTCGPKSTFTYDLHVLSIPPAFVLSQDQTLQLYNCIVLILFVSFSLTCFATNQFLQIISNICYLVFKDPAKLLRRRCDRRERISKTILFVNFFFTSYCIFSSPPGRAFFCYQLRASEGCLYRLKPGESRAFCLFSRYIGN